MRGGTYLFCLKLSLRHFLYRIGFLIQIVFNPKPTELMQKGQAV